MGNNIPTILVIYGATGDLIAKKIVPALFHLYEKKQLPKMIRIIGFSRRELTDESFKKHIFQILKVHHDINENSRHIENFFRIFSYHPGKFDESTDYETLAKELGHIDGEWKTCANKLFYLAVPPENYKIIFTHLASSGLTIPCGPDGGWTRVLVEKPFGRDLKTAEDLELFMAKLFQEEQIYRIDHYLAKEMLQNILTFRFSNNMLEPSWNNKFIEKIEVRMFESFGVDGRGAFYDGVGALRDVGQNHLMQMLALITMDHPVNFQAETVRSHRAKILKTLKKFSFSEIKKDTYRSQYAGYRETKGVAKNSETETYFKIKTFLDTPRWNGVPIYIEHGKKIKKQNKEIVVTFKHSTPCLCPPGEHFQNTITFSLEPKEVIKINFLSKAAGLQTQNEERSFDFHYRRRSDKHQYVEEYEKLLLDAIEGNQLLFVSTDEVRAMWQFVDPIIEAWNKNVVPLHTYKPNTNEPVKKSKVIEYAQTISSMRKTVGVLGLGKMGRGISEQLIEKGWSVVGYNRTAEVTEKHQEKGLIGAFTIEEFVKKIPTPRVVWMLVPSGKPVDEMLLELQKYLEKGDIVVDAGNSFYKDAKARAAKLSRKGVHFLDVGTSGGPGGARNGACLMVGGDKKIFEYLLPLLTDLALPNAVTFFSGVGAGHFVKMIHNGIEYGMMQAIAEGFAILKKSKYNLDLKQVAHIYNNGSVIESRLTKWLGNAFHLYGEDLDGISGTVAHTGEGAWTVDAAHEMKLKAKIIEESFKFRVESAKNPSYTGKVLSALRNQFGGHSIK